MATVLEFPEHSESAQVSTGMITCDLAQEAMGKQQPSEARILEWIAFPFSRGSTQPRD